MDFPVTAEFAADANPAQLHSEARGDNAEWPASFVETDEGWVYRVDDRDGVTVDEAAVRAAIDGHVAAASAPQPTAQDIIAAIQELAAEGAEVESRIADRAAQKAQERAAARTT